MSREQRLALVEREHRELPLSVQTELLSLNRSSLYYRPVPPSAEEVVLKHRIDAIYTATPFYGVRRVTVQLHREGWAVNHKAVARHMHEMGIAGICPGPNLSRRAHQAAIYPYLLREVTASYPNHIWGLDITYIRLVHGWMYLVVVLDWYSRYIISWALHQSLHQSFVLAALDAALAQAHPVICNSDQGSHFTSQEYLGRLQAANVQISMDGKGRALDNVFTERLWRTIKYEEVYLKEYATPREARHGLSGYIQFYNQERPHQALQYLTPAEVYYMKEGSSTLAAPISVS
jgi:putative transposase